MNRLHLLICTLSLIFCCCSGDQIDHSVQLDQQLSEAIKAKSPDGSISYYILPEEDQLSSIPQDETNLISPEKVELGRMLFFETAFATEARKLSGIQTYSCATCHLPEAGFRPNRIQGIADGGMGFGDAGEGRFMNPEYEEHELDIQAARPLSLVNVAFVKNTFWNGQFGSGGANIGTEELWSQSHDTELNHLGFEAIETQNIEGLDVHRFRYTKNSIEKYGYKPLFDQCFPNLEEEERYSNLSASQAISAYIRCIISNKAPFQDWLKGNRNAISDEEKEGAILFFGKANCSNCHYEKNLGSGEFHALGVKDMDQHPEALNKNSNDARNLGRGGFTQKTEDMFCFKVPGLYNVGDSPIYFHGASATSLEEVVRYKARALRENIRVSQLDISDKLQKLELSDTEVNKLVSFLSKSLKDPDLLRYKAPAINSGLCSPNNDEASQLDLDCN